MKAFEFFQDTKLIFGAGKVEEVGATVASLGKSCLIVSTRSNGGLAKVYDRIKTILKKSNIEVHHFDGVIPNPTTELISRGAELAKAAKVEVILGVGGGSSMDAAKAIAVEATHEGGAWDYLFYKKTPTSKTLPIVAVGTTSGSGSQVTQVAVLTNAEERDKSALYHPILFPRVSIIDPELMLTLPASITAATGFDVFCHAFESLLHPNRGAYVELIAKTAIQIVAEVLPQVLKEPHSVEKRSKMAWADTLAGLAIANAGVALPHGIGMAIGGMYPHVAHGQALAIIYPACTAFTWEHAVDQYAFLAKTFEPGLNGHSKEESAREAHSILNRFLKHVGLAQLLRDIDMPEAEIEVLAKQSMVLPDYKNNPRVASEAEMLEIIKASY